MMTGLNRVVPASRAAFTASPWINSLSLAKETTRMLLAVATPTHISAPMSAGTLSVVCVKKSMRTMPAMAAGKSGDDDEGIQPGLKVHDDQQVHQHNGESEPG